MRKIKFRLWDTEEKCFMNHSRVIESRVLALENNGEERFVFQQWTGLLDRHGVEIYEGDIVKGYYDEYNSFFDEVNRHEFISEVKYIDNSFKVHRNTLNDEGRIRDYGYVHEWDSELVEVIGNIYENKNLLEEK